MRRGGARSTPAGRRVLLVWANWGDYHLERFGAARSDPRLAGVEIEGLEIFGDDGPYQYSRDSESRPTTSLGIHRDGRFARWRVVRGLTRLVVGRRPNVVLVPGGRWWTVYLVLLARLTGARCVLMTDMHEGSEQRRGPARLLKRGMLRAFSAAIVGGSRQREYLAALGYDRRRVFVGYDVIGVSSFLSSRPIRLEATDLAGCRYALAVTRLIVEKDLPTLLSALALLHSSGSEGDRAMKLVIAGEGGERQRLIEQCGRLGLSAGTLDHLLSGDTTPDVFLTGRLARGDVRELMDHATVTILPSKSETWGLTVNESLATGTPALVSSAVGCTDDLVRPGLTGDVFPTGDAEALAGAMRRMARNPPGAEVTQACRALSAEWDTDRFAEAVRGALDLVEQGRRA